jgi:polysaccharide biosynthesis/export protein
LVRRTWLKRALIGLSVCGLAGLSAGCALLNGFLDPTALGQFPSEYQESGIRRVLTPRDTPPGPPNALEPLPSDLVVQANDYRIAPGDRVQLVVDDLVQRGFQEQAVYRVSDTGYIRLPLPELGSIRLQGLTATQAEEEIRRRIQDAGLLARPVVRFTLLTQVDRFFNIYGSVSAPGRYPITSPRFRLLDAIGLVGDIGPQIRELYVIRSNDAIGEWAEEEFMEPGAGEAVREPADDELVIPPPTEPEWSFSAADGFAPAVVAAAYPQEGEGVTEEEAALEGVISPGRDDDLRRGRSFDPILVDPATGERVEPGEAPAEPETGAEVDGEVDATLPEAAGELDEPFAWEDVPAYEDMQRVIRIDVTALKAGDPRYNVVVREGDSINVPVDTGVFYTMGEVAQPGVYAFNGREITIKRAIALSRGLSPLAWPSKAEIIRREPGTDRQLTIPINIDRIFAGLDYDVLLRDDDILNVGTDIISPFLFVIRNSFRFTYGFGFVYDRNFADIDSFSSKQNPETVRRQREQQLGLPF